MESFPERADESCVFGSALKRKKASTRVAPYLHSLGRTRNSTTHTSSVFYRASYRASNSSLLQGWLGSVLVSKVNRCALVAREAPREKNPCILRAYTQEHSLGGSVSEYIFLTRIL